MGRASSPRCMHCPCISDFAKHTLFRCLNWDGLRDDLRARLGRYPAADYIPDIFCGPTFENLPAEQQERCLALWEAEETFRIYKMPVEILTLKEVEERARQAAEAN